jgi:hypothetical protein
MLDHRVDLVVLSGEQDHFLADLSPLPDLAGGEEMHPRLVDVEREDVAGLETDDGGQLGHRHLRETQVLHVDDLARQRRDDLPTAKGMLPQHLPDQVRCQRHAELGLGFHLRRQRHSRRRRHFQ